MHRAEPQRDVENTGLQLYNRLVILLAVSAGRNIQPVINRGNSTLGPP